MLTVIVMDSLEYAFVRQCSNARCCLAQIFPHHENEIAQSQACACNNDRQQMANNGTDFVRFWLHNGFVNGKH